MILALDLSSHTGWAAGAPGGRPVYGVWELPSAQSVGRQAAAFSDALADAITLHKPSLVVMEADVNLHRQNPSNTALQQIGMVYLCDLICYRRDINCIKRTAATARQNVLGQSRWPEAGQAKQAVMAWCARAGYSPPDHNAADALLLWHYAAAARTRKIAA